MLIKIAIYLTFIFYAANGVGIDENLNGYQKYVIEHGNNQIYEQMVEMQTTVDDLDFWLITRNMTIVVVPPRLQHDFEELLNSLNANFQVGPINMHSNPEEIEENCISGLCPLRRSTRQTGGFFRYYHRYGGILQYMQALAKRYPYYVKFEILGRSLEGRSIGMLRISPNVRSRSRKMAYIQGGVHAREWITTPTLLYFATELAANMPYYRNILSDVDIYVVPLLNPDGYEFTHIGNRYWRKNRRQYSGYPCKGVDINRNFGHKWNVAGSSQNLCSEVYSGRTPFSEPETQWVKAFLERNRGRTKLVLDIHSFGSFLFYPWGYTKRSAPTRNFLHSVALRAASAIYKYRGTVYKIGSSSEILYEASGGLDDYAYGVLGVPMSYTIELPGTGFEVHPSEIAPIAKESFAGFIEFIRHVSLF